MFDREESLPRECIEAPRGVRCIILHFIRYFIKGMERGDKPVWRIEEANTPAILPCCRSARQSAIPEVDRTHSRTGFQVNARNHI